MQQKSCQTNFPGGTLAKPSRLCLWGAVMRKQCPSPSVKMRNTENLQRWFGSRDTRPSTRGRKWRHLVVELGKSPSPALPSDKRSHQCECNCEMPCRLMERWLVVGGTYKTRSIVTVSLPSISSSHAPVVGVSLGKALAEGVVMHRKCVLLAQ